MRVTNLERGNDLFGKYSYPEVNEIRERQQKVPWTDGEIPVEDDKQDYLITMSPEQLFLAKTTLQSFVKIEQSVGDIWHTIGTWFPHPEIDGACAVITAMEKGVHAFFYQKMSDVLLIEPEETDRIQKEYGPIKDKLDYMGRIFKNAEDVNISQYDKALTLAAVSYVEQVLLFGNFAMLKSFKANGNNLIGNTLFGVDYVIADEQLHGDLSTFLFKTYMDELDFGNDIKSVLYEEISEMLYGIVEHEVSVIELVYKDVNIINGVTKEELTNFVKHRANMTTASLGIDADLYKIDSNPIADWFYANINSVKTHDFFAPGGTTDYRKDWSEPKFSALKHLKDYNDK